ncbi:DUF6252 family protein [Desertivirga arenae]|uniref:DUF6252 family protein n=1 Tax=Desertivirga arenae TaxID=2810309 RepID=UPI001A966889|nr:DUF6252 family protein [Pedobacter sp. SYSU D00823]
MRTHNTQSASVKFLFLIFFGLVSCKKEEQLEVQNPSISFLVNGTAKSAVGADNVYAKMGEVNTLTITAQLKATNEIVTLVIPGIRGKGQFPIPGSAEATYINGMIPSANNHSASSGTIKITTYQKNGLKGTFEFNSASSGGSIKNITQGAFEAEIQ